MYACVCVCFQFDAFVRERVWLDMFPDESINNLIISIR